MQYIVHENEIEVRGVSDFDPVKIFESGQCFRWNPEPDGSWTGVAKGVAAYVRSENGAVFISGSEEDFRNVWYDYFDLGTDYAAIRERVSTDPYTTEAAEYGKGIRILAQDRWEALCSFIISQCNNIPRIKGIVERLCSYFGDPVDFEGERYYTFPSAERIALLRLEDLQPLRSGYRAEYILSAAKEVASGKTDLDQLAVADWVSAEKALLAMKGIGKKVADCMLLFGLHHMEAFPVDVWIRRALKEHFPPEFDPSALGENAGLAQQYIFYYARSGASGR